MAAVFSETRKCSLTAPVTPVMLCLSRVLVYHDFEDTSPQTLVTLFDLPSTLTSQISIFTGGDLMPRRI